MTAMKAVLTAFAVALVISLTGPAVADQKDVRLDELFAELHAIGDPLRALRIQQTIWGVWTESGSETVDLLLGKGTQAMAQGEFDKALALFNSVIEIAPEFAEGWNKRATLYYLMGWHEASIQDIDRTLNLEPRHFGALSGLGLVNLALDRLDDALQAFERALEANPHMPNARDHIELLGKHIRGEPI